MKEKYAYMRWFPLSKHLGCILFKNFYVGWKRGMLIMCDKSLQSFRVEWSSSFFLVLSYFLKVHNLNGQNWFWFSIAHKFDVIWKEERNQIQSDSINLSINVTMIRLWSEKLLPWSYTVCIPQQWSGRFLGITSWDPSVHI